MTTANAAVIRSNGQRLAGIGLGAVVFTLVGYGVGFLGGHQTPRPGRIASMLSGGIRAFAVAAALVIAVGLPAIASRPAVTFGVGELATSAGLAEWVSRQEYLSGRSFPCLGFAFVCHRRCGIHSRTIVVTGYRLPIQLPPVITVR